MNSFVSVANREFEPNPSEPIMDSLFQQYERVIFESIITSFGLDLFIKDQHGGDVDTILNVRQIGTDPEMTYKNAINRDAYQKHVKTDSYDSHSTKAKYDSDDRFTTINAAYSSQKKDGTLRDAYTGKIVARNANIDLDHVISTKEIHEDRGRILSGVSGLDLANCPENLKPTDRSINRSMQDKDIEEYLRWLNAREAARKQRIHLLESKESLTDKEQSELHKLKAQQDIDPELMKKCNQESRKAYERKLNIAYYTSPRFITDSAKAAGKLGTKMGARQVWGFIFAEIWFAEREELQKTQSPLDPGTLFTALGNGVRRGVENAKAKYKDLIQRFIDGASAGILASLTTTLCNIFFTTAKHAIRIIRQSYASLTQAMNVLFLNPEDLLFGERMRATSKILATGASIVLGTLVSEALEDTGAGKIPVVGEIITTFCGSLVSGIMTCSLLYFLDRSELINNLAKFLDKVPTISQNVQYFRQQAEYFKQYAAELMKIDLKQFEKEISQYEAVSAQIQAAETEDELNRVLYQAYEALHIKLPWTGGKAGFSPFMSNPHNHMVFE